MLNNSELELMWKTWNSNLWEELGICLPAAKVCRVCVHDESSLWIGDLVQWKECPYVFSRNAWERRKTSEFKTHYPVVDISEWVGARLTVSSERRQRLTVHSECRQCEELCIARSDAQNNRPHCLFPKAGYWITNNCQWWKLENIRWHNFISSKRTDWKKVKYDSPCMLSNDVVLLAIHRNAIFALADFSRNLLWIAYLSTYLPLRFCHTSSQSKLNCASFQAHVYLKFWHCSSERQASHHQVLCCRGDLKSFCLIKKSSTTKLWGISRDVWFN